MAQAKRPHTGDALAQLGERINQVIEGNATIADNLGRLVDVLERQMAAPSPATVRPVESGSPPVTPQMVAAMASTPGAEVNNSSTRDLRTGKAIPSKFLSTSMVRLLESSPKYPPIKAELGDKEPVGEVIRLIFGGERKKYLVNFPGIGDEGCEEWELGAA